MDATRGHPHAGNAIAGAPDNVRERNEKSIIRERHRHGINMLFPAWLTPSTPYREGTRGYTAEKVCRLFSGLPSVPSPRTHRMLCVLFLPLLRRVHCATRCRHRNANTQYFALHHPTIHRPVASPAPGRTFFAIKNEGEKLLAITVFICHGK